MNDADGSVHNLFKVLNHNFHWES